ncbi:hypothetical protein I302_101141 [Kwoniella bestiolae CBS 10118]|uniref:Uncharacterized protein n=1 Tax=Kwoniella bestiolae CBS 10118 TaxID=1296100 RepID=A0A1B9G724_9TREE|nr:hypothetical protein I302_04515 [Kwoniella bestiolae CBS 10118]OCF26825.1 hypothetical protein I302_04515 [Kwoniella bestiolae CBS 10118]
MPLFNSRRETPSAPLTRQPIDLQRLLAVYDDYPNVLRDLESTSLRLEEAEESARVAYSKRDDAEKDLLDERKGRKADNDRAASEKEKTAREAKKDKADAEKAREEKVRNELNPKIKDLETRLKSVTDERNRLDRELTEKKKQMELWITNLEKLSIERKSGYEKERKAVEERWASEEKTRKLDEDILTGLKKALTPSEVNEETKVNGEKEKEKEKEKVESESEPKKVEGRKRNYDLDNDGF